MSVETYEIEASVKVGDMFVKIKVDVWEEIQGKHLVLEAGKLMDYLIDQAGKYDVNKNTTPDTGEAKAKEEVT